MKFNFDLDKFNVRYDPAVDRRELLDGILRLAAVEGDVPRALRPELRLVRSRLEDELGQTVRPAEAAELLGVSQTALAKWLDQREIPSVVTPTGRREIPVAEVVGLAREVERARHAGRERAVSAVVRERRRRARETIDVDRLLPSPGDWTHRNAEVQSLAYHRLVAERLTPDLIDAARERVDRWERSGRLHSKWADAWREVLGRSPAAIRRALRSSCLRARQLRQTSPFAGVLTEQERLRLVEAIHARR